MGLCVQERGIKQSVLFPKTMISRLNLLPRLHFYYLVLIENLFDSCFGKDKSICSHRCVINFVTYNNNVVWRCLFYTHN